MKHKKFNQIGAGLLSIITLASSSGCAVEPTKETPAPSTPIESLDPTIEPTLAPIITPSPTPDLTFRTIDDIGNEEIAIHQANLIVEKINNSSIKYTEYLMSLNETNLEDLICNLQWFSSKNSIKELNYDNFLCIVANILSGILNQEMWTIIDILEGRTDSIENARFVGFSDFIPINSNAYILNNRLEGIKIELASKPPRERQLELTKEINDLTLKFILSFEEDSKNNYFGQIETEGYKFCIWANLYLLYNVTGYIDINANAQYPEGHENYPEYMKADEFIKKVFEYDSYLASTGDKNIISQIQNNEANQFYSATLTPTP
jgi:hypothetical protein